MNIDLTNATDQLYHSTEGLIWYGSRQNVDASGYTGNFGAAITASASGSIITGTANVDDITLTTGKADTVKATDAIAQQHLLRSIQSITSHSVQVTITLHCR